jgi:hypothetical protein
MELFSTPEVIKTCLLTYCPSRQIPDGAKITSGATAGASILEFSGKIRRRARAVCSRSDG